MGRLLPQIILYQLYNCAWPKPDTYLLLTPLQSDQ